MKSKSQLRKEILQIRDRIPLELHAEQSGQIAKKIIAHEKLKEANKVLLYASFRSEVETMGILESALQLGKQVYFPKVTGQEMLFYQVTGKDELKEGYQGIYEPQAEVSKQLCLQREDKIFVLMPGAVFERSGRRIGYGGGYYDKFLEKLEKEISGGYIYKAGAAFSCQLVENGVIPAEIHDIPCDAVITEEIDSFI